MDAKEIVTKLSQPFEAREISKRKIGGGRQVDYVEGHSYITRLNTVAPSWSFRITKSEMERLHVTRYDKQRQTTDDGDRVYVYRCSKT